MGILDEAIREHLELKRQHGADDSELEELENAAFGPAQRPGGERPEDVAAEAPTQFMQQPEDAVAAQRPQPQEAEQGDPENVEEETPKGAVRREPIAEVQEPPAPPEPEEPGEPAEADESAPAEEEQPAAEHKAVPSPPHAGSHSTEERHAIASQPTEMFDVQKELEADEESAADAPIESADPDPTDEDLVAEEAGEPRLGTADAVVEEDEDEDDEFWDEKRLSDELDQALTAPVEEDSDEHEQPDSEEMRRPATSEFELDSEEIARKAHSAQDDEHEDVLDETPEFLEGAPEDEQLWFEQKPPKDFDFDD